MVNSRVETTAGDIVKTLGIGDATARQYLRRLAEEHRLIARVSTGIYGPVTVSQVSQDRARSADEEPADPDDVGGVVDRSQDELALSDA